MTFFHFEAIQPLSSFQATPKWFFFGLNGLGTSFFQCPFFSMTNDKSNWKNLKNLKIMMMRNVLFENSQIIV